MRLLALLILLSTSFIQAQTVVTSHGMPPGYTSIETRFRNELNIDSQDNIWVAFASIGLGKYDGSNWIMYDSLTSGLPSDSVTAIDFDASGNIWIGTKLGAAYYNGSNWITYNTGNSGLPANLITTVLVSGSMIWFGTKNGVASFDGINWATHNTSNSGISNDTIITLCKGQGNDIFIGTNKGLNRFASGVWTKYDSSNSGLSNDKIFDLCLDLNGRLWITTYFVTNSQNLFFLDAGSVHSFMDEYYSESYGDFYQRIPICLSPSGVVTSYIAAPGPAIFLVEDVSYTVQYFSPNGLTAYPGFPLGRSTTEYDSQGHLWFLNGFQGNANAFLEIEINNYTSPLMSPTIYNAKHLEINDAKALLLNRGHLMYEDYPDGIAYEIPKGSGKRTMYASALWIAGKDQYDSIHVAAEGYYPGYDFFPGPVSGISIPFDSASCSIFNRMWNIHRWEIASFQDNFASGAVTNGTYAVPEQILNWPAKGNGLVTDDIAPFVDVDGNGFYDPYSGDYPDIKGDQSIFWIFNDSLAVHGHSGASKLGVEVLATAYAFSCPGIADSNSVLNTTTFYNYKIRNRSIYDYSNLYLGLWCSPQLGNFDDDYIGCDTMLHAGFVYNGDSIDDGSQGYGYAPPVQNVVVLKGPEADQGDGIDNDLDGTIDESGECTTLNHFTWYIGDPVPWGWPYLPHDFYNYLQSIWLDSTHMVYGGHGHDPSSTNYSNFLYPGTPYDTGWTEINEGNMPGSRMFIIGSGPVSLAAGNEISLDFAYVFTQDSINPNGLTTSVARNISDVQRVHTWFNNQNFPSCLNYSVNTPEIFPGAERISIYPNPAKEKLFISSKSAQAQIHVEILDITGRMVIAVKYDFTAGINIRLLKPGIYTIRVVESKSVFTEKFIKSY